MQFIDLAAQQKRLRKQIEGNIQKVLDHGQYIMGPEIRQLEENLARFSGVRHAVACASGTDALLLALMAHGVGPGDGILTTPFTFIATGEVIQLLGAVPVFVDIDEKTFNIDPGQLETALGALRAKDSNLYPLPGNSITNSLTPKGIIAVDLFGLPADYEKINAVASDNGLFVIEDAAQSFGAEHNGQRACSLAQVGCTSFFPAKPLGCYGDAGMCFTDDKALAETLRSIRIHGKGGHKYDNVRIGINGRMDTLQAAILLSKFSVFPEEIELRQAVAMRYAEYLASVSGLALPLVPAGAKSVWAQYSVLASGNEHRQAIQQALKEGSIPTAVYYPKPLHLQTAFSHLGYREGDFPVSEDCSRRIFSLPMHPYLTEADQKKVAAAIHKAQNK